MQLSSIFGHAMPLREIVLDTETTGLYTKDGHRVIEVAAVELINGKPSGVEFHVLINPERDIPDEVVQIHHITNEKVKDAPIFAGIAKQLRDFIGDSNVIITCRTGGDGYTLDIDMLKMEMTKAGQPAIPDSQWVNVRRWSEVLFGQDGARLDKLLDHYKISREERDAKGHSAILDTRLLAAAYPMLLKDYMKHIKNQPGTALPGQDPKAKP
jgi:DNA polymerase-3 subunit epsilon